MRVLIADDHTLLSESLRIMLERDGDVEVVGVAENGYKALELCKEFKPDIVLMDIKMPDLDGISATRKIKENSPETRVLVLTSMEDTKWIVESFAAGADGYLLKDTSPERLTTLIRCVYWGYTVSSSAVLHAILDSNGYILESMNGAAIKDEELKIIKLISEGKSNSEIAKSMNYAEGTVKNKVTKIIELAGVENRAQLVLYAIKNNLI